MTKRQRLLTLSLGLLLLAGPALAQHTVGEISGYVRDTSGGALPGATVTAAFVEIAVTRAAVTNAEGFFVLPGLPNGVADITAELDGFQKAARRGVAVELNARLRLDFSLAVGGVSESVDVTAETPVISTRADVAHLISGDQTKEIPIDGRTYMQLLTLVPGVSRNEGSYEFGTSFRADGQQINGLRKNFAALTLDGSENLDVGSNATQVNNVSIDAIEEFKVMTSQYAAEYGKAGGAQVNVVTKRGKRDFAGTAYYFLRDDSLDSKNFRTGQKDVLDFSNFGWNFSGPVSFKGFNEDRSKLFFFVSQEYKDLESQVGMTKVTNVPSLLERDGNFSQSPTIPRDPLTGQPFPGGLIPASRISANGKNLISRFPLPDSGSRNQATLAPVQDRAIRQTMLKFDIPTGPAANLSLRYIRDRVDGLEPYGSFGGTSSFAQVPTSHDRFSDSFIVNYNHPIGRRMVNEVSLSLVRNDQELIQTGDLYQRTGVNIPEVYPQNRGNRAPNITSMTGYTMGTGLMGVDYPTHLIGNYYTLRDNLTWSKGTHTFKAGIYFGHFRKSEEVRTADAGAFTFSSTRSGGSGVALADALLGLYETYRESDIAPYGLMRYNQVEVYAQDHWQVKPYFTIDYGFRYQYMPPVFEVHDQLATFDPALYDPAQAPQLTSSGNLVPGTGLLENGIPVNGVARAGQDGVPRGLYATDWNNIAPRLGFTWDPWKSGRTAIRGGFGIFYDRPVFNSTRDQGASIPLVRSVQISNGLVDNPGGGTSSSAPPGGFEALSRDFPMPVVYQYSVGFQRQLPWSLVIDVNYVGNQARNLLRVRELNYATPASSGTAPTPVNASRPYRGYGRIIFNETTGESQYNSLQVALNRRASKALSFGVSYTLGKAEGDSDSEDSTSSGSLAQDPRNLADEYGLLDFDRRHVLAANYIWRLPELKDKSGFVRHVLGGWQLSGITKWNTGRRYSVTGGTNTAMFGDAITVRANLVPGQDPNAEPEGGRTEARWFNTAAFSRPATNTLGDSPRNVLEGPSYFNSDLSLVKNVRFSRKLRVQLRAESFNLFNTKNYRTINTNITASAFGSVTEYENQRIFQLGAKLYF